MLPNRNYWQCSRRNRMPMGKRRQIRI